MTIFACLMASTIPAVLVRDVRLSIALVSLAMLGYTGVTANMLAMPADVFPQNVLASIWGYGGLGSGFGGMVFALIMGWCGITIHTYPFSSGLALLPLLRCSSSGLYWDIFSQLMQTSKHEPLCAYQPVCLIMKGFGHSLVAATGGLLVPRCLKVLLCALSVPGMPQPPVIRPWRNNHLECFSKSILHVCPHGLVRGHRVLSGYSLQ